MFHERRFQLTSLIKKNENNTSISADGTTIAVETEDNTVTILRLADDEIVMQRQELEQSENKLGSRVFALSPNGKHLATYASYWNYRVQEEFIRLWDTMMDEVIQQYDWNVIFPTQYENNLPFAGIMRFQFLADGQQLAALTAKGEVAVWNTSNGNLLRFIGQSSRRSNDIIMSHDGKWFISLEDNVEKDFLRENRHDIPIGRYYQGDTDLYNLYAYQSRVCYNFERYGFPRFRRTRHTPILPLGVMYLGRIEPVIFNICDAYSGAQIRNLTFPMPENVMIDRAHRTLNTQFASNFQLSHDDSMLMATVDSNIFL